MPKRLNIKDMLAAGVIEPGPVIVKYCKLDLPGILHKNGVFSQSINIRATARKKKVCMLPAFATASGFGLHMLRTVNPAVQTVNGYACIYYKREKLGVIRDRLQAKNDAACKSVINTVVSTASIDPKIKTPKPCSKRKHVVLDAKTKMISHSVEIAALVQDASSVMATTSVAAPLKKRRRRNFFTVSRLFWSTTVYEMTCIGQTTHGPKLLELTANENQMVADAVNNVVVS
jgi:hypothetical protein